MRTVQRSMCTNQDCSEENLSDMAYCPSCGKQSLPTEEMRVREFRDYLRRGGYMLGVAAALYFTLSAGVQGCIKYSAKQRVEERQQLARDAEIEYMDILAIVKAGEQHRVRLKLKDREDLVWTFWVDGESAARLASMESPVPMAVILYPPRWGSGWVLRIVDWFPTQTGGIWDIKVAAD